MRPEVARKGISRVALALAFAVVASCGRRAEAEEPKHVPYVLVASPKWGMEAGVRSTESLGRLLFRYEELLPTLVDESHAPGKALAVVGRAAKLFFVDSPLTSLEETVIHETFGHGSRGRDVGQNPGVVLRLPGVYCSLFGGDDDECVGESTGGSSSTGRHDTDIAITLGGVESNYLTSFWTNVHIVQREGWVHHTELLLYWASRNSYRGSIVNGDLGDVGARGAFRDGDDIYHYVTLLQDRFDRPLARDRATIASRLQTGYAWNFVDPTLLYALYGTFVGYLWKGEPYGRMPLPRVGKTTFYPETRFNLSPFGAEHYLDVLFGRNGAVLDVYGRVGSSGLASYTGAGARLVGARVSKRLSIGGELDVWNQPEIAVDARGYYDRENRFGWNAGVSADVWLTDRIGLTGRLAYKTAGYAMGQPLGAGPHGYVGVSIMP